MAARTPRRRPSRRQRNPEGALGRLHPAWVVGALLLAGLLYAAADPVGGLTSWHRLEAEVAEAEARVRAHRVRNAQLSAEIRDLRERRDAEEAAIREVIGWVRPGELRVDVAAPPDALPLPPPHR